jgi:hypothetical protein
MVERVTQGSSTEHVELSMVDDIVRYALADRSRRDFLLDLQSAEALRMINALDQVRVG